MGVPMSRHLFALLCLLALVAAPSWADRSLHTPIKLEDRKVGEDYKVIAHNLSPVVVSVRIEASLQNMVATPPFPRLVVCPPGGAVEVATVRRTDFQEAWRYTTTFRWMLGDVNASHDPETVYRLPYSKGSRYRVIQAADGSFSHFGTSRYAIDFDMPEDSPILASRSGTVVRAVSHFSEGGTEPHFKELGNHILIQHDDGTIAEYFHLRKHGALVDEGQRVQTGQLIGRSGNTGYSAGPHLHFMVYRPARNMQEKEPLPVRFLVEWGRSPEELLEGYTYQAP